MAIIKAPNPITGLNAGLMFHNGVAQTSDPWLIRWCKEHGYTVEEDNTVEQGDLVEEGAPSGYTSDSGEGEKPSERRGRGSARG